MTSGRLITCHGRTFYTKRMHPPAGDVTQLLNAWCNGDSEALDGLAPVVESKLRRLARIYLNREPSGHTLQPQLW